VKSIHLPSLIVGRCVVHSLVSVALMRWRSATRL
jgi:hypothetical protein